MMDFQPRKAKNDDDNLIPLINIVFLLLIFFMVAGQIQPQPDAHIEVPVATYEGQQVPLSVFVSLDADDNLTWMNETIRADVLAERLEEEVLEEIAIVADARVTAAQLEAVMAEFRQREGLQVRMIMESTR